MNKIKTKTHKREETKLKKKLIIIQRMLCIDDKSNNIHISFSIIYIKTISCLIHNFLIKQNLPKIVVKKINKKNYEKNNEKYNHCR